MVIWIIVIVNANYIRFFLWTWHAIVRKVHTATKKVKDKEMTPGYPFLNRAQYNALVGKRAWKSHQMAVSSLSPKISVLVSRRFLFDYEVFAVLNEHVFDNWWSSVWWFDDRQQYLHIYYYYLNIYSEMSEICCHCLHSNYRKKGEQAKKKRKLYSLPKRPRNAKEMALSCFK